jgi:hypothetical protein
MPRSGSTLLSAILSQITNIHSEGTSSLGQIMLDTKDLLQRFVPNFEINKKPERFFNIISNILPVYYSNINAPIIIDKSRSWTHQKYLNIMYDYITPKPKIVVMQRPLIDIVKSYMAILINNNNYDLMSILFEQNGYPIMQGLDGLRNAKINNNGEYLFVQYDDLVDNTEDTIKKIYEFYEIEPYKHKFNNIEVKYPENDSLYVDGKLLGLHDVRPTISRRKLDIELSEDIIRKCEMLDIK